MTATYPAADRPDVDLDWYAERILNSQDVRMGPLRRRAVTSRPVDRLEVAAVLHGMADHTMNTRLLTEVVDGQALCPPDDPRFPGGSAAVSLGRWFHRVADVIELTTQHATSPLDALGTRLNGAFALLVDLGEMTPSAHQKLVDLLREAGIQTDTTT